MNPSPANHGIQRNDNAMSLKLTRTSALLGLLACALVIASSGCSRAWYRRQADIDANNLIREKASHPHWALNDQTFAMDPRARYFDGTNPDKPPMPPDDPYSHEIMHCVDGKRGYPGWHDHGDNPFVENPAWRSYLELDEHGVLRVNANDAVRLGLIHSRNYRQQLEELYLSALDVSFERFRFDAQGFGGYEVFYTAEGRNRPGNFGQSQSILEANTFSSGPRDIGFQKLFTTGSTLVVGFANSLVWQFSGPDDYTGATLIDFAFVQPLLRGAGRDRVLERLTVSERNLLANVRAMEQYREAFYVQIMTGRDPGQGPNRQGGVFGGSGLEGFTGTGGGGFGRVGGAATVAGGTASGGAGAGAGQVGGYLGLLQTQQEIRNQEDNVERLRNNLFRLEQFLNELKTRSGEEGLINNILRQDLQVAQARQALFNAESRLLNSRNNYQATLDNFKLTLGLPPELCIDANDSLLDPFQLIDRESMQLQLSLDDEVRAFGEARLRITQHIETRTAPDPNDPSRIRSIRVLAPYPELTEDLTALKQALEPLREIRRQILEETLPKITEDVARYDASVARRREWLQKLRETLEQNQKEICALLPIAQFNAEVFNVNRLTETQAELRRQLISLESKVRDDYETHLNQRERRIDDLIARGAEMSPEELFNEMYDTVLYPKRQADDPNELTDIFVVLPSDLLALQLVQARARTESVQLAPIDIKIGRAIEVARKYRRDWMNARAGLVDAWRLIEFNADNLEGSLNILFSGDVQNLGQNPFNLNSTTGALRTGVQFDAPITRLAERNTYRQALIEFQQARRNYYNFEDQVIRQLRGTLRTVAANQLNFELQRLAVLEAARQIDRNEDIRIDQELTGQTAGATAARDAVSALTDLLDAQNNFMSVWVNYEALRRSLDLDLGTMQLDSAGLWIDPGNIGENYAEHDPWLWQCGVDMAGDAQRPLDAEALPPGIGAPQIEGYPGEELPPITNPRDLPRGMDLPPGVQGPLPAPSTRDPITPPEIDPATEELQLRPFNEPDPGP